ncbi:MAG: arginine--tRNA ligase [Candidatus Paceibacterota bacterium]
MQGILVETLKRAVEEVGYTYPTGAILEHPAELSHGDYASNVALMLAKEAGKNPRELALEIAHHIEQRQPKEIAKVEVAGAGFINFTLSEYFLRSTIERIISEGGKWGSNTTLSGKKVLVEYTDPNPFKEFHIGHLMNNTIGEATSRLVEFAGAETKRANYQGDVGPHVAKAIWGKMKQKELSWGEAYAYGAKAYEENETAKKEITEINKKIYEESDEEINKLYREGRKDSFSLFEEMYALLGTSFDFYFFESEVWKEGLSLVRKNVGSVFAKSDGAIVYRGEADGLHTRVFVNSEGLPTYEAKDLGLALAKKEKYPSDISITVTASEQTEYFKVVLSAMEKVMPQYAKKVKHISHGMMRLPSGKMSSRTGDVVTAEVLIENVKEIALKKMEDAGIEKEEEIAEMVAIAAIKYSILKQTTGKDIIYDPERSLSFEGASGPYLQYAHTRAHSILTKAGREGDTKSEKGSEDTLERLLYRFPEVVARAQNEYEPHYVVTYLTELASSFNSFYAKEKIIGGEHEVYNLALARAFQITMQNGLWLLGIKTPQRM